MDNPLTSYAKTVPKVDNKWEIKDTGTELNRYKICILNYNRPPNIWVYKEMIKFETPFLEKIQTAFT
ncbi:MAG: hypothetical protein M1481_03625 [Candidatus Thermoplasmatota archaeon]|jgi:hypothetical protein|nr:hypothetical protein [Candidatus Thermoplasmatota archaeon]